MKNIIFIMFVSLLLIGCVKEVPLDNDTQATENNKAQISDSDKILEIAFRDKKTDFQVEGKGDVIRLLSDDETGSRHQRFILELASKQTILIAHNIDLAARIDTLQLGGRVGFRGDYEWNSKGGVVHWTHDDPKGIHRNGWLKYNDIVYR